MAKLLKRLFLLIVVVVATAVAWSYAYGWLEVRRHPQRERLAMQYMEQRLGEMTPEQRKVAESAVSVDPWAAMLAAHDDGWNGVAAVSNHQITATLQVESIALEQLFRGNTNQVTASAFANSALPLVLSLQSDAEYHADPLDDLRHLSPEEFDNVEADDSYLMIGPRLDTQYREDFQANQTALTPLISMADPKEWNTLMADFERAKPEIIRLFDDPVHGRSHGYVYMLNLDTIRELMATGLSEEDAIRFVGVNCFAVSQARKSDPDQWATRVKAMQSEIAPDGSTSLFQYALGDASIYWLLANDPSADRKQSVNILTHYAGSNIPAIMSKYAAPRELMRATIDAMDHFGCGTGTGPKNYGPAAVFIAAYQDNDVFKATLAHQGARLIPALSVGDETLKGFYDNPKDIDKYVDANGNPKGKPLWTWLPSGNIVYVIKQVATGQTASAGDWGWAAFDGAFCLFVPIPGVDGAVDAVGGAIGKGLARFSGDEGAEVIVDVTAKKMMQVGAHVVTDAAADETVNLGERAIAGSVEETGKRVWLRSMLRAAGTTVSSTMVWGAENPVKATVIGFGATYLTMNRDQRTAVWNSLKDLASDIGQAISGAAGETIKSVWSAAHGMSNGQPLLGSIFYAMAASITIFLVLLPLLVLRLLLPEVYRLLIGSVRTVVALVIWIPRYAWKYISRRCFQAPASAALPAARGVNNDH